MAYDIRLHLQSSPQFQGMSVELTTPDGRSASIPAEMLPGVLQAQELASHLLRGDVLTLLEDALRSKPPEELGRILFVDDFRNARIPWESILHAHPLSGAGFVFVFWSDTPSPLLAVRRNCRFNA